MKTSTHHSSVHLNSNIFTDKDVWMPKVLMTVKDLRESLTDLSELPKLTAIEPNTKHIEFVQEGQNYGHPLFSLGLSDIPKVDPHNSITNVLMDMYQNMGDALALQYGGYIAHNIVFLERYGRETLTLGVGF